MVPEVVAVCTEFTSLEDWLQEVRNVIVCVELLPLIDEYLECRSYH